MKLAATYQFAASRETVFAALNNPDVLRNAIEGCEELVPIGEDTYEARVRIGLAAIKGSYKGKVQLKDKKPPESFTLVMEGKGTGGFIRSTARVELTEAEGGTRLRAEGDATVGGIIAAVGSRLIEGAARKMMTDFFRKLATQIGPGL